MVVRRTIHHLRGRPVEDRRAAAAAIAIAVMVILFLAWAVVFFGSIRREAPLETAAAEAPQALPAAQPGDQP